MTASDWVYSTVYRAHGAGWGHFSICKSYWTSQVEKMKNKPLYPKPLLFPKKGKRQFGTTPCLDPPLMLLGTSDMHLILHPLYQPSQSGGQAQAERQKQFCFKSYSLLRSRWCWSFRRWKSANARYWDCIVGPYCMFCVDWCSNAWPPCGTDPEENSWLYPVGYRENWSSMI